MLALNVSQYTFCEGTSACTVIAATALQQLLSKLNDNKANEVDENLLTDAIMTGVNHFQQIAQETGSNQHLSVEVLSPQIMGNLQFKGFIQGMTSDFNCFDILFGQARSVADGPGYIGLIITKPPETICMILPPKNAPAGGAIYSLFDSHARPQMGYNGAYYISTATEGDIVRHLKKLFPALEFDEDATEFQLMYNMVEVSMYQLK